MARQHLRLKGDFLETTLSKSRDIGGGWTMKQGARARLRGEASTYDESTIDLETGLFRDFRGPIGDDFQGKFQFDTGIRHRFPWRTRRVACRT